MGQEVGAAHFRHRDFVRFEQALAAETDLLHDRIEQGRFAQAPPVAGLELEAWLVDRDGNPAPMNQAFLERLAVPDVVTELARFNIELNVPPQPLAGDGLARLAADLAATWDRCQACARSFGLGVVSIGILPTLTEAQLCLSNMSVSNRYRALNEQMLRQHHGRPVRLDIAADPALAAAGCPSHLRCEHRDVMLEAGTTSLQAHLQVTPATATRYYNAAIIASAPMVALAANAPFLFGHALWDETRVPLFEQALDVASRNVLPGEALPRVSFGSGYAGYSLAECFRENQARFEIMLPLALDGPRERLPHLRLHNGTIWRWNRPLVGFGDDGTAHLRIEHRVMAAGPTIGDMLANLAFFYGLAAALAQDAQPPELELGFETARANFYEAARRGLAAQVAWIGAPARLLGNLVVDTLLARAAAGLRHLDVDDAIAGPALRIIEQRAVSGRTGADWQRRFVASHGADFAHLTREYAARQSGGAPVHTWTT